MIKRNGQRIAAITMAVALMGQNVTPIFSLENLTETAKVEDEAKNEETTTLDQAEEENESLTEEEYEALPKACEVCGSTENLCIDHDHITGKVRGVLCLKCNSALGLLGDSKEVILKLASYIEKQ